MARWVPDYPVGDWLHRLTIDDASNEPPADILEALRLHKAEIFALLSEPDPVELEECKGMAMEPAGAVP